MSIHHFALTVADVPAAILWYGKHFGFRVERSFSPDGGKTQIAHITTLQGVRIELLHVPDQYANPDLLRVSRIFDYSTKKETRSNYRCAWVEHFATATPAIIKKPVTK